VTSPTAQREEMTARNLAAVNLRFYPERVQGDLPESAISGVPG
jgi:hypothetical protein